jgi:Fe-S-cluster-containing dehydrogenase component
MERRSFLKGLLGAGTAVAAVAATSAEAEVRRHKEPAADAIGMLYDSTLCIGCKACVVACREANGLQPEGTLHDRQTELNCNTKNVIKLYKDEQDPSVFAFMKQQCMHCIDPACVSACMIGAFHKEQGGLVAWDGDKCVGCRYCQVACPFQVPKFEWDKAAPKIVKCEFCKERLAKGGVPACTQVCPRHAVIFGKLEDLKAEAHKRLAAKPSLYQPKVYGEEEAGGTQVLYLSAVPFEKLGLPKLDGTSIPYRSESVQHGVYQGMITPVVLYAGLAGVVLRNWRSGRADEEEVEEELVDATSARIEKQSEKEKRP